MLATATTEMNAAVSDPANAGWRVKLQHKLNKVRKRALVDYVDRRDNYDCDASDVVSYDEDEVLDEQEDFERGLPAACLEAARPFRKLSLQARSWMDKWNMCGNGPPRANLRDRMWKSMRLVRKQAYIAVGCDI